MSRCPGKDPHRVKFTPDLWRKWLKRLNQGPNRKLAEGIETQRMLLAARDIKR